MTTTIPRRASHLPIWRKVLYALIATVLFLGLLEFVLMTLGVSPVTDLRDPYVGFSSVIPLMEEIEDPAGKPTMVTRESKLIWFNKQAFGKVKQPGTRRVFCVGGSTTYGRPYADATSYCGWLREFLPIADNSHRWEVINAGGVSYASYRVATVVEELCQYQPDLFVVYSAHNEFLEHRTYAGIVGQPGRLLDLQATISKTRVFALFDRMLIGETGERHDKSVLRTETLSAEVDERLNHTIGPADYVRDPTWQDNVIEHYQSNLQRIVRIARRSGARVVFVAPAANEKDCSPFKSEPGDPASPELGRVDVLLQKARQAMRSQEYEQAVQHLEQAQTLDHQHAEVHFRLGKARFASNKYAAAQTAFIRALNEDVCPLRAIDSIDRTIRVVAGEYHVPIVEFGKRLHEECYLQYGHRCLGDEYFLDHVHPTIETHRQLALWIIDDLQRAGLVGGHDLSEPALQPLLDKTFERVLGRMDQAEQGVALRNLAKVLHWSGKFDEASLRASDALEMLANDPESRFILADCLKNMGETEGAIVQYELLFDDHPQYARAFLPYGELLVDQGSGQSAMSYLLSAILTDPNDAYAYYVLGRLHMSLNEWGLAVEALQEAIQLDPDHVDAVRLLNTAQERRRREE